MFQNITAERVRTREDHAILNITNSLGGEGTWKQISLKIQSSDNSFLWWGHKRRTIAERRKVWFFLN